MRIKRIAILLPILFILALQPAVADVRLPRLLSDGMVLQRDTNANIWGWADAGERIRLQFRDRAYFTTAGQNGKWKIQLAKLKAGGPYHMEITATNRISLRNVYIGDVWICSGQSNMELPMERVKDLYAGDILNAANPYIRHFTVPDRYNFKNPEEDLPEGKWAAANPESVLDFSAVGYFFARELYARYQVPIGLINTSLGGSPVEAWISEEGLVEFPHHLATAREFRSDALIQQISNDDKKRIDSWYALLDARDSGFKAGSESWASPAYDASNWPVMRLPAFWDEAGLGTETVPVNGVVWFRKEISVPPAMVGKPARLLMGRIVDADATYINGEIVGSVSYQYPPRKYDIAPNVLKPGKNLIAVRVISNTGRGGFIKDKPYRLIAGQTEIDLNGEWRYQPGASMEPLQAQTFIRWKPLGLYNAMIAPLLHHPIKGVIWYQGESNTRAADEYAHSFPALIRDWRGKWHQGDFPFLYVQLANFMDARDQPSASEWAQLREAQLKTLSTPRTAMAVSIDLGEWNDIHPLNKKDVGERLALAARKIAYGESKTVYSGPLYRSMRIEHGKAVLSFNNTGGGLIAQGGNALQQFAICGADKKFVWANARIEGDKVVVWSDTLSDPVAVRYAWADNPRGANLYNKEGLPASPFRTDNF